MSANNYTYGAPSTYSAGAQEESFGRNGNFFNHPAFSAKGGWLVKGVAPSANEDNRRVIVRLFGVPMWDQSGQIVGMTGIRVPKYGARLTATAADQYELANAYRVKLAYIGQGLTKVDDSGTIVNFADLLDQEDVTAGHKETALESIIRVSKVLSTDPQYQGLVRQFFHGGANSFEDKSAVKPASYSFFILGLATQLSSTDRVDTSKPRLVLLTLPDTAYYSLRGYVLEENPSFGGVDTAQWGDNILGLLGDANYQAARFRHPDLALPNAPLISFNRVREGAGKEARNKYVLNVLADQNFPISPENMRDLWMPDNQIFKTLTRQKTFEVLMNIRTNDQGWYSYLQACARNIPDLSHNVITSVAPGYASAAPAQPSFAPGQGFAPQQPVQGYAPQAPVTQPSFAPAQPAQGYAPQQAAPQPSFAPAQPAQGFAPPQAAPQPAQGYAPAAQPGFAPQATPQGYAPQPGFAPQAQAPAAQPSFAPAQPAQGYAPQQAAPQQTFAPAQPAQGYAPQAPAQPGVPAAAGYGGMPATPFGMPGTEAHAAAAAYASNANPGFIQSTIAEGQVPWAQGPAQAPAQAVNPGHDVTGGNQAIADAEQYLKSMQ